MFVPAPANTVSVPPLLLQEVLQIHSDKELRSPEFERWWEPGLTAQHHDGPEEVLQSPLPVPCGSCGTSPAFVPLDISQFWVQLLP